MRKNVASNRPVPSFLFVNNGELDLSPRDDQSKKLFQLKLTIFYNDIDLNRKFLTCTIQCKNLNVGIIDELRIAINGYEKTQKVSLPKTTEVGDLVAFLRHTVIPKSMENSKSKNQLEDNSNFIYSNTTSKNQKYLQVMDCSSSIFDLMNRPLDKGIIMIRDKQNSLCALVSKVEMGQQHNDFTESYTLIEEITNEISFLMEQEIINSNIVNELNSGLNSFSGTLNQKWKQYIDFFENEKIPNKLKPAIDSGVFVEMLNEITRIVRLLYVNHQVFLSEKDKAILRDSLAFFHRFKELKN